VPFWATRLIVSNKISSASPPSPQIAIPDGVDGPRSPASMCHNAVVGERHNGEEPSAMQAITIGVDLAKQWFQVQGADAAGRSSSSEGCVVWKSDQAHSREERRHHFPHHPPQQ
jgi:hypothetical protein